MIEYRIGWSASSNISFRGFTDWEPWDGDEATEPEVENALCDDSGPLSQGFETALERSGFEWWIETRESA